MKALKHIFLFLFITTASVSYACSCILISKPKVENGLKNSDVVFVGAVIGVEKITEVDSVGSGESKKVFSVSSYIYTFKVEKKYKRKRRRYLRDTIVKIRTGSGGGDCGFPFIKGEKYIVYAQKEKGYKLLTTDICTRTTHYNKKEITELERLTN